MNECLLVLSQHHSLASDFIATARNQTTNSRLQLTDDNVKECLYECYCCSHNLAYALLGTFTIIVHDTVVSILSISMSLFNNLIRNVGL